MKTDDMVLDPFQLQLDALKGELKEMFKRHLPEGTGFTLLTVHEGDDGGTRLDCASTLSHQQLIAMMQCMIHQCKRDIQREKIEEDSQRMLASFQSRTKH